MNPELIQRSYDEKLKPELEERKATVSTIRDVAATEDLKKLAERVEHLAASGNGVTARDFERIIGRNDMLRINYLERGLLAARAVARIRVADAFGNGGGWGTGFMVSPRLMLTNNHVIGSKDEARRSIAGFGYESDITGMLRQGKQFRFAPDLAFVTSPKQDLDFTLVAVEEVSEDGAGKLSDYGFLRLDPQTFKTDEGLFLTIVQHPNGDEKFIAVRENEVLKIGDNADIVLDNFIWYASDTAPGSSGAPAFNENWQVVALHHRGVPRTIQDNGRTLYQLSDNRWVTREVFEVTPDDKANWIANEGVRVSKIVASIIKQHSTMNTLASPLVQEFLDDVNGIRIFEGTTPRASVNGPRFEFVNIERAEEAAVTLEKAKKPKKNFRPLDYYDGRQGYRRNFLGVEIPLPDHSAAVARFGDVAEIAGTTDNVLRYTHFSVVMNVDRRMAYYTAVNIDGKQWRNLKRGTDKWFYDPRLDESLQLGDELYGNEPVPGKNYFDRGHLVRRLDPVWGNLDTSTLANDDTFHWTNCSPQYKGFNQGDDLWQGLENYILYNTDEEDVKATIFNGPIFAEDDEEHRGTKIPQAFWKLVLVTDSGTLYSSAYVVSQEEFAQNIPFEELPIGNHNNFQTTVEKLEQRTGLRFADAVRSSDVRLGKAGDLEIQRFSDIDHPRRGKTRAAGGTY